MVKENVMNLSEVEIHSTDINNKHHRMNQTEIGLLPEDWQVVFIKQIAPLQRGFDLPISKIQDGVFPVVFSNGINKHHNQFMVKAPGIVTGRSGTIGKVFYIEKNFWPHNTSLFVTAFNNVNPKYVYFLYNYIDFNKFSSGSGVPTLNRNDIHDTKIPLPPLPEQEAIAEALSDADAWIESLEQLIAKKRLIKQGAMQELLTPKEDWEVKKLGEVCDYRNGKALESFFNNLEGFKVISIGNYSLQSKYKSNGIFISKEYKSKLIPYIVKAGELTMILNDKTASGEIIGRTLLIETDDDFIINQRSIVLKPNENILRKEFLYFFINCDRTRNEIFNEAKPGTQIYINTGDVLNLKLAFPKSLTEQTRISTVLLDIDTELEALEAELGKARKVKQGMMQELLTGRVRLV